MRCVCCDDELTDFEATRKSATTGAYLDMCNQCFSTVADEFIEVEERADLKKLEQEINEANHEL